MDAPQDTGEVEGAEQAHLAGRFVRGEPGAFDELVAVYQPRVGRLAQRLLGWSGDGDAVADVVQDVFFVAFKKAGSFRGGSSLWTWLTAITLNRCRSHLRQAALVRRVRQALRLNAAPESPAADEHALGGEAAARVRRAVAALPPAEREVVVLYYLEQRPVAEIATLLGVSANAVQIRMFRARQQLKSVLVEFAPR